MLFTLCARVWKHEMLSTWMLLTFVFICTFFLQAIILATDGVATHRMSSATFWPVAGIICNLPSHLRYLSRLVHPWALIPGCVRNLQTYFVPVVRDLLRLMDGIEVACIDELVRGELLFTTGAIYDRISFISCQFCTFDNIIWFIAVCMYVYWCLFLGDYPASCKMSLKKQKSIVGACNRCTIKGFNFERRIVYRNTEQVNTPRIYEKDDAVALDMMYVRPALWYSFALYIGDVIYWNVF